ncbi:hypothetical protein M8J76_014347 [Diaphorina citri]|nr:hypothetical protein M8J75_010598 [Diaphorina citri]KAI5741511.1 hypothetical protein M8J76_014347 [Diaphorina citri]
MNNATRAVIFCLALSFKTVYSVNLPNGLSRGLSGLIPNQPFGDVLNGPINIGVGNGDNVKTKPPKAAGTQYKAKSMEKPIPENQYTDTSEIQPSNAPWANFLDGLGDFVGCLSNNDLALRVLQYIQPKTRTCIQEKLACIQSYLEKSLNGIEKSLNGVENAGESGNHQFRSNLNVGTNGKGKKVKGAFLKMNNMNKVPIETENLDSDEDEGFDDGSDLLRQINAMKAANQKTPEKVPPQAQNQKKVPPQAQNQKKVQPQAQTPKKIRVKRVSQG